MFRDFHRVPGAAQDYLYFPESGKFYALPKAHGAAIDACEAGEGAPPAVIAALLEKEAAQAESARRPITAAPRATDSLCLYMAHECNLACSYCYNDGGRAAGHSGMMSPAVAEAAMRRWFTEPGRTYAVSFYGGEPLLNFQGIQAVVAAGEALERERAIRIEYSMTSNGTVLSDEMVEFIDRHIHHLTLSLDGPPAIHDRHRRFQGGAAGRGSYTKVVENLRRLKQQTRAKVTLKATLTGDAVAGYEQTLAHLQALGADGVGVSPVWTDAANPAALSDADHDEYVRRHSQQVPRFFEPAGEGEGGDGSVLNMVINLLTRRRFSKHCDAGSNPAVAADGSIYACHGLVGSAEFYMGHVDDDGAREAQQRERFHHLNVLEIAECRRCWARYLCGGSCYAHAHFNTGSVQQPDPRHCAVVKAQAEAVIAAVMAAIAQPQARQRLYARVQAVVGDHA